MQRQNAGTRPDIDILGHGSDRRGTHRRIGVKAAKGMKMPLRRPDRLKSVLIGEFRPLQQQTIGFGAAARHFGGKIEQAESRNRG